MHYLKTGARPSAPFLASGEAHLSLGLGALQIIRVDVGDPSVILAGAHVGCYELFATERIRSEVFSW